MDSICPACSRLIYDRKRTTCGFCGAGIPPELMFTEVEIKAHRDEMDRIEAERKVLKEKEEQEELERRKSQIDYIQFLQIDQS